MTPIETAIQTALLAFLNGTRVKGARIESNGTVNEFTGLSVTELLKAAKALTDMESAGQTGIKPGQGVFVRLKNQ